jgi:serine/threonine protein kinase
VRIPYRLGPARGFRYGEVPAEIEAALPRWLATSSVEDGTAIKPGRVYRRGPWVVKLGGASRDLKDLLRPASSIRSADLHARLLPVRTPAPLVALELRRGPFLEGSVLVSEFMEGPTLREAFPHDDRARDALAPFLALLHRNGVFHGDLHPANMIWNGSEWVLIDLDSLRHPLRRLFRGRLILEQWAQLAFRLGAGPELQSSFESYLVLSGIRWDPRRSWGEVIRRSERIRSSRSA